MADKGLIELNATILPDDIQKELTALTFSYEPADTTEKWVYKLGNVTGDSEKLIESTFASNSIGVSAGSRNSNTADADKCRFLFIKNTGTTNGTTATSDSVYIVLDGDSAAYNAGDAIEVPAGMTWYARLPNTVMSQLYATTGTANGGGDSAANVQCIIAAIIDNV